MHGEEPGLDLGISGAGRKGRQRRDWHPFSLARCPNIHEIVTLFNMVLIKVIHAWATHSICYAQALKQKKTLVRTCSNIIISSLNIAFLLRPMLWILDIKRDGMIQRYFFKTFKSFNSFI